MRWVADFWHPLQHAKAGRSQAGGLIAVHAMRLGESTTQLQMFRDRPEREHRSVAQCADQDGAGQHHRAEQRPIHGQISRSEC